MKGVIFMSGRRIYSDELKLEMVQRYFSGEGGTKFLAQNIMLTAPHYKNGLRNIVQMEWME